MNTYQKEILFESRKKNMFIAYLLGCFLGGIGMHRFYLKDFLGGSAYIVLLFLSMFIPIIGAVHLVYLFVDFFLTYRMVNVYNLGVRKEIEDISGE